MKKRIVYICACFLVLTVFLTSCYKIDGDGMENTQIEDNSTEQTEGTNSPEELVENAHANDDVFNIEQNQEQSVAERVEEIQKFYNTIQNNLSKYRKEDGGADTTRYWDRNNIKKITASTSSYEHFDNKYNVEYFYEDNTAFFIYLYNKTEEHRIYLAKDNGLECVRYIDVKGNVKDYQGGKDVTELPLVEQYCVLAMQELEWAGINVTEENKEQNYQVINCNEWVSLREGPGSSYKRLKKVPLGAIVTDYNKVVDGFRYVWFENMSGYIGEDYLQVYTKEYHKDDHYVDGTYVYPAFHYKKMLNYDEIYSFGNSSQKITYGEYTLLYSRGYTEAGEIMKVGCFRNRKPVWGYVTGTPYSAELDATAVIPTESVQNMRYVVLFNSEIGLKAIDFSDGSIAWEINVEDLSVGGSPCYTVDEKGTLYISGYYDVAPVAVTFDGEVLWKASVSDSDVYWPYKMEVKEKNILVTYASEHEKGTYVVTFDKESGKERKIEIIPF